MSPATVNAAILAPLFLGLLPPMFDTPEARVMLLAICGQEANFEARVQRLNGGGSGPARGLWQFERGGGVHGVLNHAASAKWAAHLCLQRGVEPLDNPVHRALANDDLLAAGFARLLLYTDPKPLPAIGDEDRAFAYYLRTWRPGAYARGDEADKAHLRAKWAGYYAQAVKTVDRRAAA